MLSDLPDEALAIVAECLMLGGDPRPALERLASCGLTREQAEDSLRLAFAHPFVRAGRRIADRGRKIEAYLDMLGRIWRLRDGSVVELRETLRPEEFYRDYFFGHRPVHLRGMLSDCLAIKKWTPAYLSANFGDAEIEVMAGRASDKAHETNLDSHRRQTTLRKFIQDVEREQTNDIYLNPHNRALLNPSLAPLLDDILEGSGLLNAICPVATCPSLWLGPAGTITELHHDRVNLMLMQIYGRKEVQLLPSCDLHRVQNNHGVWSDLASPEISGRSVYKTIVGPGDMLFIPVGWWHRVRALDVSISVTLTEFDVPGGNIEWLGQYWVPD